MLKNLTQVNPNVSAAVEAYELRLVPTSPNASPTARALTKLPVVRENPHRQANGRLRVHGAAQRRLCTIIAIDRSWPGRAKTGFKLAAVNRPSKAIQQGKSWADLQRPVMAGCTNSAKSFQNRRRYAGRNDEWQFSEMRLSAYCWPQVAALAVTFRLNAAGR